MTLQYAPRPEYKTYLPYTHYYDACQNVIAYNDFVDTVNSLPDFYETMFGVRFNIVYSECILLAAWVDNYSRSFKVLLFSMQLGLWECSTNI